jgi:hypothetical protein
MGEGCGETKCPHIKQWDRTNPDGYLITQYDAPAAAPAAPAPASSDVPAPSGDAQSSPAGAAGLVSVPTPLSSGA